MKQSAIALALLSCLITPVSQAQTSQNINITENRAAQGDITMPVALAV